MSKRTAWNSTLPAPTKPMKRSPMKRSGYGSIAERMDVERGPKGHPKPKAKKTKRRGHKVEGLVPLPKLVKDLDRLTTQHMYAIRGRRCYLAGLDGHACEGELTTAHILPRWKKHVRHDPANVIPVCWAHHQRYEKHKEWPTMVGKAMGDALYYGMLVDRNKAMVEAHGSTLRPVYETWQAILERSLARMAGQQAFDMEAA